MKITTLSLIKSKTIPVIDEHGQVKYKKVQFSVGAILDDKEGQLIDVKDPYEAAKQLSQYIDKCDISEIKFIE